MKSSTCEGCEVCGGVLLTLDVDFDSHITIGIGRRNVLDCQRKTRIVRCKVCGQALLQVCGRLRIVADMKFRLQIDCFIHSCPSLLLESPYGFFQPRAGRAALPSSYLALPYE
jgi:hypothetical protein